MASSMSEDDSSAKPSAVTVLALLEDYAEHQEEGNNHWKQSQWNLYKARHFKAGHVGALAASDMFQAADVREDLRARSVLKDESTPDLVEDEEDEKKFETPRFVLVDLVEERLEERNGLKENADAAKPPTATSDTGLRHRKTSQSKPESFTKEWSVEQQASNSNDPEERLLAADPIDLFDGAFPPRQLKVAQEQAKQALASYVQAANFIVELQQHLTVVESSKKD